MSDDLFSDSDKIEEQEAQAAPGPSGVPSRPEPRVLPKAPLADWLRPTSFDDYLGQEELVGEGGPLRTLIESDRVPSMILWGPPGSGKTTLASIIAKSCGADFVTLSAVTSGVKDVRKVVEIAKVNRQYARRTILFVDEIHRFNKAQQDGFLPHVESGLITFIGATTENPSFSVISPLLSRCRVYILKSLEKNDLRRLLERGVVQLAEQARREAAPFEPPALEADSEALDAIVELSDGDARRALGMLEIATDVATAQAQKEQEESGAETPPPARLTRDGVLATAQRHLMYDRSGEEHYNLISALHKTIRSSDPHGAVYWCERMMMAGEDPRFVLRRLIRIAAEDVGLADPNAVQQAVACAGAFDRLGTPEGDLFVTQLAVYLACAPKSDAVYKAANETRALIQKSGTLPVPMHLRNAPTGLMKAAGYSSGYTYDHDFEGHFTPKQGLPDELDDGRRLYRPSDQGVEARIAERLRGRDEARDAARKKREKRE